jgi:hypothetical protein
MRSKSFRNILIETITSYLDLILHHHPQSSPLGSAPRAQHFCQFWNASWKCFFVRMFSTVSNSAWISSTVSNLHPLNLICILGKRKKLDGASDNLQKRVSILLKLLLKFPADFQAMLLLFIVQQSWHKLGHNPPHVQFFWQHSMVCTIS